MRVDILWGSALGKDMLTNNRPRSGNGVTEYKEGKGHVEALAYFGQMFPPCGSLLDRRFGTASSGSFGSTVGSMEVKKV